MAWGNVIARGLRAMCGLWLDKKVASRKRAGSRRRFKRLLVESLEGRDLLAADFLYSLEARPGVPSQGFGFSLAANDQFHVVANFAPLESYYFLEDDPDYDSFFYGEVQVHDATTGELLRTIENPLPFGNGQFGGWGEFDGDYEFNFRLTAPNAFGYSVDIFDNLILVGSPGWDSKFSIQHDDYDFETGGRAFLFDANTGDLLHTFDGSFEPIGTQGRNNDGFGRSVSVDGNRISIGAPGPNYEDEESQIWDTDPGHVYIYSATTGNELHLLELPNPNQVETLDFGTNVSLSDGKLVVTQGYGGFNPVGETLVYDVPTGDLLHSLAVDGSEAVLEGNNIAILEAPGTTHLVNATTGAVTQTIPGRLYDFDGNLLVSGPASGDPTALPVIRDFPSGNVLYSVPTPPGFTEAYFEYNQIPQVFEDRLLVPGRQGAANENVVFVYSVTDAAGNGPPTDIALSNNSVPENSANGAVVGTLSATDPDSPETFTYSLLTSAGGRFAVNGNQLVVDSAINFESTPELQITVQATDSAGNTYSEVLTITVTDVPEPPLGLSLTDRAVREGVANGTPVSWIENVNPLATEVGDNFAQNMAADGGRVAYGQQSNGTVIITDEITGDLLRLITNPAPQLLGSDFFGTALALSGDLLVVGARFDDVLANDAGIAYVFNVTTGALLHTLQHPAPGANDQFGSDLSIHGSRIVVGAPGDSSAFVFSAVTGNLLYTLDQPGTSFGFAVQVSDSYVAVGAFNYAGGVGRAFVYDVVSGNLLWTLDNPNPGGSGQFFDGFGGALVIIGQRIVVGSPGDDASAEDAGSAYVFNLNSGSLIETLTPTAAGTGDRFGLVLTGSDNNIAVGRGSSSGRVELFHTSNWSSQGEIVTGESASGFGLAFIGDGVLVGTSPNPGADRVRVYNEFTLQPRSGFRVLNPGVPPSFTFTLLDDAGGRFALVGDQLVVANSALLDADANPTHTVVVRVTNAQGLSLEESLVINVVGSNNVPTDITLSNSAVAESTIRVIHRTSAEGALFGGGIAAEGGRILVSEQFGVFPDVENRVPVIDAVTGEHLRTLAVPALDPTAADPDGSFGISLAISGNRAFVGANSTKVGNLDQAGRLFVFNVETGDLLLTLTSPTPVATGFFGGDVAISGNVVAVSAAGEGTGKIHLFHATTGQLLETIPSPVAGQGFAFGQSLAMSGNTLVAGSRFEDIGATDSGRAYIYEYNPATQAATLVHTLNNPTPAADERFGGTVAVSGNLVAVKDSTAVAGATNVGSVHLFNRSTGAFLRTIDNPAPGSIDQFGAELIISGDLIITNSRSDVGGTDSGRAFVFRASTGALLATIENPSPNASDEFAFSLSVMESGIVASARGDDTDGNQSGLVYVFDLPIGQPVGTLSTVDPDAGDTLTYSLTNNADGRFAIQGDQIVIADATKLDFEAATSHNVTVQVTDAGGNTYSESFTITVTPANEPPQDIVLNGSTVSEHEVRFIHNPAVALAPNVQFALGTETSGNLLLVGSQALQSSGQHGSAFVFDRTTGALLTTLTSPTPQIADGFGSRVAISGNLAVVGSHFKTVGGETGGGEVHVFNAATGTVQFTLSNPDPVNLSNFGVVVAIDGARIAVASRPKFGVGTIAKVFLYDASTGNLVGTIASSNFNFFDNFGPTSNLQLQGNTIVIGGPSAGSGGQGRVFVYQFDPVTNTATLTHTLSSPTPTQFFGMKVDLQGSVVAVSAPADGTLAQNTGRAFLFDVNTGALLRTIDNPTPNTGDNFGSSLTLSSEYLVVSAIADDTTATNSGSVYVFEVASGNLVSVLNNPTPNNNDSFGTTVAIEGTSVVVGARNDSADGQIAGMVYAFNLLFNQVVSTLSGTDPDTGDTLTYALLDDASGRFKVVGSSIVVADPSRLNFEANASHNLLIKVTDSTGLSTVESLVVLVTNGNEPPQDITFAGNSIPENAGSLIVVSTLSTTDPDAGSTITYSLDSNAGGRFAIAGSTIIVANGTLLDFETASSHTVTVRATDAGGKFVLETLRINVSDAPEGLDYGDLPNSFGTLLTSDGARHATGSGLRLGATVTGEANGQPSANANLDSGDDGVTLPAILIPGLNATVTVNASQVGRLDAFIDYDNNGSFSASERITPAGGLLLTAGANSSTISIPGSAVGGNLGARFRISSLGGLGPTGLATDGEVEDYRVSMATIALNSVTLLPDPESPGSTLMLVNGTQGSNNIVVAPFNGQLRATINGVAKSPLAPLTVSRIVIFGLNGADDIRINTTTIPGYIDGGAGKDTLRGGNGPDTLLGQAGNDTLYGRNGDDVLFGGIGNDDLYSDAGIGYLFGEGGNDSLYGNGILVGGIGTDSLYASSSRNLLIGGNGKDSLFGANVNQGDIIIAGFTAYDTNLIALKAIHAEWKKAAPVATRIGNLNGSTTGGLNGTFLLDSTTVLSDVQVDAIFNNGSNIATLNDWIFKSPNDNKPSPKGIVVAI